MFPSKRGNNRNPFSSRWLIDAETFATGREQPPEAVRICFGCSHSRDRFEEGLTIVKDIIDGAPPALQVIM